MADQYKGHKYEQQNLTAHATKVGRDIHGKSQHKTFHKTVNVLTLGGHNNFKGMGTPEHKKFAASYGYEVSKGRIYYKRKPDKVGGKRAKKK